MNRQQRRASGQWKNVRPDPSKFLASLEKLHAQLVPLKDQLEAEAKKLQERVAETAAAKE